MSTVVSAIPTEEKATFRSVLKRPSVRILAVSRAASKLAQATVSYGVMVFMATAGATQLQISIVSASTYVAALFFGLQGGTLADSLSKRNAIIVGYIALALTCIVTPFVFGTGVADLMFVMFLSSALMQIVSPSLKSAVALVSSPSELATVGATISVVGSIASAAGSSVLAPVLVKVAGINALLVIGGLIYLLGAIRTYRLPISEKGKSIGEAVRAVNWKPEALSLKKNAQWILEHLDIGTAILVGAIVVALFEAFNTLIPVYVRDVLDADPTNAVYIFAPAGIGFLIGTFLTPRLIDRIGARKLAVVAAAIMCISMVMFGLVDVFAGIFAPVSPLRILGWALDIEISKKVLAASTIAVFANYGSTAAGASVQTFINANVPLVRQGATFGLQEVQENGLTLVMVMTLGIISSVVGPETVFVFAPIVAIVVVVALIRYSYRASGKAEITRGEAFHELVSDEIHPDAEPADQPPAELDGFGS
jgi:MFS family permease